MISPSCLNAVLPVVADSWERLRGCDVYRLLDQIAYDETASLKCAASIVKERRPDLENFVDEAVADLMEETGLPFA